METDWPGFKVAREEDKMGIRGSSTAELVFEELRVPHENVLGKVGEGFITFMKSLDMGRLTLERPVWAARKSCWSNVSTGPKPAFSSAKPWPISRRSQWMIANMATEIEALRSLV